MRTFYTSVFSILLSWFSYVGAGNYVPPIGIPAPEFGIDEKLTDYYTRPNPWDQEVAGWYYIDQYHVNASNSNTYGTPDNPRSTIPEPVPAGSVVEVHGTYDFAPTGYDLITTNGTAEAPVFIVGDSQTVVMRKWVMNSAYTVIENIEFTNLGKIVAEYPTHHLSIRNNNLHHIPGKIGGRGVSDGQRTHHIVIYNNQIHSQDGWDQNPTIDLDNHGIKFGRYVDDVWVLDNLAYNNGGSFIQVGDWRDPADNQQSRRFYIGRNTSFANRQSPIGVKQSHDVIISENVLYDNVGIQTNAAGQAGIEYQYGSGNLWIINNHIYDSNAGVSSGSDSGGVGQSQYIIGNLIHDVHASAGYDYNVNTGWSPAAIMLAGGIDRHVINNTIYNADAGINIPSSNKGSLEIVNNIIYNATRANHIFLEPGSVADVSIVHNNILFQPTAEAKIRWGGGQIENVADFETSFPLVSANNQEADPQLYDPTNDDYSLQMNSISIDAGTVSSVYQTFYDLYGIDIRRDRNAVVRPDGVAWDVGAYEFPSQFLFQNGFE